MSLKLKINSKGEVNGIRLTTFTLLTPDIICGPTPMLNPPLLIPTNTQDVLENQILSLNLKYVMGGGLDTIEARIN